MTEELKGGYLPTTEKLEERLLKEIELSGALSGWLDVVLAQLIRDGAVSESTIKGALEALDITKRGDFRVSPILDQYEQEKEG